MQASAATFSSTPMGHKFQLRVPLAKATAGKCRECGVDIRQHHRDEVTDDQLLQVLTVTDDGIPSIILDGELAVGSYKAAIAACRQMHATAVINTAGLKLQQFIPRTRKDFEVLRHAASPRLIDVEWEESESFKIQFSDIENALAWGRTQVAKGRLLLINCAQGKSRSGTMAVAYVMAKLKLSVDQALALVKERRPLVEPNPAFIRALREFETRIHQLPVPMSRSEAVLTKAFPTLDKDGSGGLNLAEWRAALVAGGGPANEARALMEEFGQTGELSLPQFVQAVTATGCAEAMVDKLARAVEAVELH